MRPSREKAVLGRIVHRVFLGLNEIDDPITLVRGDGSVYLTVADNVDLDARAKISRRSGYTQVLDDASCHSLGGNSRYCFGVVGENLVRIYENYSYTVLLYGVGSGYMSFADTGNGVYFTNDTIIGKITGGTVASLLPVVNKRYKSVLLPGHIINYSSGRLYVAHKNVLLISDAMNYGMYDLRSGFKEFESRLTGIAHTEGGTFVSDSSSGTHYLSGRNPEKFTSKLVSKYPAILGTMREVQNISLPDGSMVQRGVVWASEEGLCLGTDGGGYMNLTRNTLGKFFFTRGCSLQRRSGNKNQIIFILK